MPILIGDLRTQLAIDLRRVLEQVINDHKKLTDYYILVTATPGEQKVETRVILMRQRPPKLLGTICWYVNNREGKLMRLWVLPYDWKWPEGVIGEELLSEDHPELESIDKGIRESMRDMPILLN